MELQSHIGKGPANSMKSEISNKRAKDAAKKSPEWANGLRQLYNSVVDEPLPDSFKDLLSQLDDPSQSGEDQ